MKFVPNSVTTLSADLSVIDIACTMEFVHGKKICRHQTFFFFFPHTHIYITVELPVGSVMS